MYRTSLYFAVTGIVFPKKTCSQNTRGGDVLLLRINEKLGYHTETRKIIHRGHV
jgi:hypothetical protein